MDLSSMLRESVSRIEGSSGLDVFSEEPVALSVFVQDKKFLANPPLSAVQYDAVRHIERIYYPALYPRMGEQFDPYWAAPIRMINFATLQWGKGGGKDHICRIASMRIAYLLMCLRSPQEYYGIPPQDTIHLLNVASSAPQAQQAFFMPITRAVKRGWFADRCDPHMNTISYDKNVECISGHSDAETQEGLNLMLGIADEIDAFKSKKEMSGRRGASGREPTKSAEGILDMIRTSGSTRFPEMFKNVRISYPRYKGSTIQLLTAAAKKDVAKNGDTSRHYVSGPLATWEVNPRVTGKAAFADDYDEDPVMAAAKYECLPARATNPYFRNDVAVESCFTEREHGHPVELDYAREGTAWTPVYEFAPDFVPIQGAQYAMHGDLAVTGDRAGIACAHVVRYEEYRSTVLNEEGEHLPFVEQRPIVKVDFVIAFEADARAEPPREIQIRWARQLAFDLIQRGFNIRSFTYDGYQSKDSMQILEARGIESTRVSTDLSEEPWRTLRDLLYEGRITIPGTGQPIEDNLLRGELLSLTRLSNGRIDHPSDFSKDMADALACAVLGAVGIGGQEDPDQARAYYEGAQFVLGTRMETPLGLPRDFGLDDHPGHSAFFGTPDW